MATVQTRDIAVGSHSLVKGAGSVGIAAMKANLRALILALSLLVAIGIGYLVWSHLHPTTIFETAPVVRGSIESRVTALGVLQPRSFVDVGAQVSGVVQRLAVQPGARVSKGDLLVEIDPSVQQATVDAGRAALAVLRAQLAEQKVQHQLAVRQFERQVEMSKHDATREEDVQTAEAAAKATAARIESILAQISQTEASQRADEVRLSYTRIYAPMTGTVVSVEAREGQTLNVAFQTTTLLRVADLTSMTVWAEVSEADVRRISPNMPAYFTTLGGDRRRWDGRVRQVLPAPPGTSKAGDDTASASGQTRVVAYTVLFDVVNTDGALMPRMTAQVSFVEASAREVLMAPLSAFTAQEGAAPGAQTDYLARVLRPSGKVESAKVSIGIRNRIHAEVKEGLKEGDLLITGEIDPSQQMKPSKFTP